MGLFSKTSTAKPWITPKAEKLSSHIHGKGLFAIQPIMEREVIAIQAGQVTTKTEINKNKPKGLMPGLQILDNFYIGPSTLISFNHSCDPNIGMAGNIMFIAMKDIDAGEE